MLKEYRGVTTNKDVYVEVNVVSSLHSEVEYYIPGEGLLSDVLLIRGLILVLLCLVLSRACS